MEHLTSLIPCHLVCPAKPSELIIPKKIAIHNFGGGDGIFAA